MYPLLKEKFRYIVTESEIYSSQQKYFMKEKTPKLYYSQIAQCSSSSPSPPPPSSTPQ